MIDPFATSVSVDRTVDAYKRHRVYKIKVRKWVIVHNISQKSVFNSFLNTGMCMKFRYCEPVTCMFSVGSWTSNSQRLYSFMSKHSPIFEIFHIYLIQDQWWGPSILYTKQHCSFDHKIWPEQMAWSFLSSPNTNSPGWLSSHCLPSSPIIPLCSPRGIHCHRRLISVCKQKQKWNHFISIFDSIILSC